MRARDKVHARMESNRTNEFSRQTSRHLRVAKSILQRVHGMTESPNSRGDPIKTSQTSRGMLAKSGSSGTNIIK